jgi:hypothetical protein
VFPPSPNQASRYASEPAATGDQCRSSLGNPGCRLKRWVANIGPSGAAQSKLWVQRDSTQRAFVRNNECARSAARRMYSLTGPYASQQIHQSRPWSHYVLALDWRAGPSFGGEARGYPWHRDPQPRPPRPILTAPRTDRSQLLTPAPSTASPPEVPPTSPHRAPGGSAPREGPASVGGLGSPMRARVRARSGPGTRGPFLCKNKAQPEALSKPCGKPFGRAMCKP